MKGGQTKADSMQTGKTLKSKGAGSGKRGKKAAKDPNKPKRPASAFFVFMEEFRRQYKEEHPDNKSVSAVGKAGVEKWKSMAEVTIKMQLGVQVLVTNPRELEKNSSEVISHNIVKLLQIPFGLPVCSFSSLFSIPIAEADMTKERIEKLLRAGANVVLTTKGIDVMALKYFVEAGAIAVRRVRKEDMHHVAKATGATMVSTFADMEGKETFDSSLLGYAEEVVEERIADGYVVMIKGTKSTSAVSLILRGANDYMLDEMERALHDALSIVKRTLESNTVLAVNAAKDATELVAKLRASHHTAQTKADKKHFSRYIHRAYYDEQLAIHDCWSASSQNSEDDKVVAFQDIKPAAFRHYLVISVEHIPTRSSKKKEETQRCTSVKSMQQVVSASATRQLRLMTCSSSALPQPITEAWETITGVTIKYLYLRTYSTKEEYAFNSF
ncbi:hypothetical protein REPUB_Repub18cG0175400 [Reevesia pubescens]